MDTPSSSSLPQVAPVSTGSTRRGFLKAATSVAIGAGLIASGGTIEHYTERWARRRAAQKLDIVLPKVSMSRYIRSTVGLRPHRPIGFKLEKENLGSKILVHNWGHGGSGWSLAWGTGELAIRMAEDAGGSPDYAVLGSGIVGLATARLLQRRGKNVTIYTKEIPPRVTSNYAAALWTPTATLCDPTKITPEFKQVFEKAARISFRYWTDFIGHHPTYGVHYVEGIQLRDPKNPGTPRVVPPDFYGNVIEDLHPKTVDLTPDQHPFDGLEARLTLNIRFETHTFLFKMLNEFLESGGKIVIKDFGRIEDIDALPEKAVIACIGLGAKAIFNDPELNPIRGQLNILAPQKDLRYSVGLTGSSASPRWDGVAVGNSALYGNWDLEPDMKLAKEMIGNAADTFAKLQSYV